MAQRPGGDAPQPWKWVRAGRVMMSVYPEAGDHAPALLFSLQAPAHSGGFFGPVAQPDRATVS
jgi:hypothetical protein